MRQFLGVGGSLANKGLWKMQKLTGVSALKKHTRILVVL